MVERHTNMVLFHVSIMHIVRCRVARVVADFARIDVEVGSNETQSGGFETVPFCKGKTLWVVNTSAETLVAPSQL